MFARPGSDRFPPVRVVGWNIRAGGGRRAGEIAAWVAQSAADVVVLSEFRGSAPSAGLAAALSTLFPFQHRWLPDSAAGNGLFLASRRPSTPISLGGAPGDRWLAARFANGLTVAGLHVPNIAPDRARKLRFRDAVFATALAWPPNEDGLIIGDTNSGRPLLDEENAVFNQQDAAWFETLAAAGWHDTFRHLHPDAREYTWYSPNAGNGFRIDQAFANRHLLGRVTAVNHVWAGESNRRDALSDHAALVVDIANG